MGYCVDIDVEVLIPKEKIDGCLQAINELQEFTDKFNTLMEALDNWDYGTSVEDDGNVKITYFQGEKWGDDEVLYKAIAPFVKNGSLIEVVGEDGCHWRYIFFNGKAKHQDGIVGYFKGKYL
ncbi:MAG: hypothetical protein P9M03_07995 [Candidatus Theseobacter exili]|nr:hypothetical protein [Candidatus Theseobacter exili]